MINITRKENCTGCYACENVCPKECITMQNDSEGFWYPKVDIEKCNDCGLCEKVCPIIHKKEIDNHPKAYACYNKDEEIRLKSSSGGMFTLIAEQVIDNGGVVFGARFDEQFNVIHDYIEIKEKLEQFRGSKYVQSRIGDTYKQAKDFLKQRRQVLFTGTPCQIGGLKSYLQRDYTNLFCMDIICHGVPSPRVWQKYISYQKDSHASSPRKIAFRQKNEGWKRFSVSLSFNNDTEYLKSHKEDLYMKAFLNDICLRPSCYSCNFKTLHRESDITLADFWGIQNMLPELDDDKGTSLIFVNSTEGRTMFKKIQDKVLCQEVDTEKAVSYNSAAIKPVAKNEKRESFFEELEQLPFDKLVKKSCSQSLLIKIKRKITRKLKHSNV